MSPSTRADFSLNMYVRDYAMLVQTARVNRHLKQHYLDLPAAMNSLPTSSKRVTHAFYGNISATILFQTFLCCMDDREYDIKAHVQWLKTLLHV